jgi:hypothetical protein
MQISTTARHCELAGNACSPSERLESSGASRATSKAHLIVTRRLPHSAEITLKLKRREMSPRVHARRAAIELAAGASRSSCGGSRRSGAEARARNGTAGRHDRADDELFGEFWRTEPCAAERGPPVRRPAPGAQLEQLTESLARGGDHGERHPPTRHGAHGFVENFLPERIPDHRADRDLVLATLRVRPRRRRVDALFPVLDAAASVVC